MSTMIVPMVMSAFDKEMVVSLLCHFVIHVHLVQMVGMERRWFERFDGGSKITFRFSRFQLSDGSWGGSLDSGGGG